MRCRWEEDAILHHGGPIRRVRTLFPGLLNLIPMVRNLIPDPLNLFSETRFPIPAAMNLFPDVRNSFSMVL